MRESAASRGSRLILRDARDPDALARAIKKPRYSLEPGALAYGLAVTYFRVRKRHTIIGANPFHGPVRDGKAWFQVAVAARLIFG